MNDQSPLKASAGRVDKMAALRGVDLQENAIAGKLKFDEIADAVLRCRDCSNPEHCDGWMAASGESVAKSPEYCRNADLFARLSGAAD